MHFQGALSHHIHRIFHTLQDSERSATLQLFIRSLIASPLPETAGGEPDGDDGRFRVDGDEKSPGIVFQTLNNRHRQQSLSELDLAMQVRLGDITGTACVLALVLDLPFSLASATLESKDKRLLLIVCRAGNFAWSTVESVLSLDPEFKIDRLLQMECSDEYHTVPVSDARRLLSLTRLNFKLSNHSTERKQSA